MVDGAVGGATEPQPFAMLKLELTASGVKVLPPNNTALYCPGGKLLKMLTDPLAGANEQLIAPQVKITAG
jgi:hypothetical protein